MATLRFPLRKFLQIFSENKLILNLTESCPFGGSLFHFVNAENAVCKSLANKFLRNEFIILLENRNFALVNEFKRIEVFCCFLRYDMEKLLF